MYPCDKSIDTVQFRATPELLLFRFPLCAFYYYPTSKRFSWAEGLDTCALPSYYKLFDYVTRIELIVFHPTF